MLQFKNTLLWHILAYLQVDFGRLIQCSSTTGEIIDLIVRLPSKQHPGPAPLNTAISTNPPLHLEATKSININFQ